MLTIGTDSEAGAAIGVARNALTALDLIGPSAPKCLERAGAMPMSGVRFMLGQGEGQGSLIAEEDRATHGKRVVSIVHRAAFPRELLADVPPERLHSSKELKTIEKKGGEGPVLLGFTSRMEPRMSVMSWLVLMASTALSASLSWGRMTRQHRRGTRVRGPSWLSSPPHRRRPVSATGHSRELASSHGSGTAHS